MATPFLDQIATLFARGRRIAEPTAALSQFRRTIERARADLPATGLDEPSAALARQTLERVTRIAAAYSPERIEEEATRTYRSAADFHSDLLLLLALTGNPAAARELLAMRAYVEQAAVPSAPPLPDAQELAIDRAVILERLSYTVPVRPPTRSRPSAPTSTSSTAATSASTSTTIAIPSAPWRPSRTRSWKRARVWTRWPS